MRMFAALLALLVGCGSSPDSGADDGTTNGFQNNNTFGGDTNGGGTAGTGGNGGGTGANGALGGDAGDGASTGAGGGAGGYTGPLENVGDPCTPNGTECIQGRCSMNIPTYGDQPGGFCTRACAMDSECGADGICPMSLGGSECLRKCTADGDCREEDYFCGSLNQDPLGTGSKVCRPKPGGRAEIPDGKVGGTCDADADCGKNGKCKTELERRTPAPDGYCSGPCFEDTDCGSGGLCVGEVRTSAGVNGQCYLKCTDKSMCGAGDECRAPFTADGSLLGLVSETVCLPPPPPTELTGDTTGKLCTDDAGCPGGVCEKEVVGRPTQSGICTGTCTTSGQCGTGADCYGANALAGTQGECLRKCTSISNCAGPTEHVCVLVNGLLDSQKYCVPRGPLEPIQMP